jgi:xanthine dehydrogenase YagS FAD-binding subunit
VLKADILPRYPEIIININAIPGMDYINETAEGFRLGAVAKIADIAGNPRLQEKYPVLVQAARSVATPEIRNMATLGGNLCQDIRCMYYRYPHQIGGRLLCWRKGGKRCLAVPGDNRYHAIMGGNKCFAVCPSDMAVALTALNASIKITGPDGERIIPVNDLYNSLGNNLQAGEMITEIQIPPLTQDTKQAFIKFTLRAPVDFALVSIASVLTLEEGLCKKANITLGGIAPAPVRATIAEQLILGRVIDDKLATQAAAASVAHARPLSMNEYKIEIVKALVKRAIFANNLS